MKLVAIGTIHANKVIRPPVGEKGEANYRRGKYEESIVAPGESFDTNELGISDDEAKRLIDGGAAKRFTKEVPVDGDTKSGGK